MASNITVRAFCTTLSLGLAILNGLISFLPGFGIITLLAGDQLNFPLRISLAIFTNQFLLIPSRVVLSEPFDIFPGLLFISR